MRLKARQFVAWAGVLALLACLCALPGCGERDGEAVATASGQPPDPGELACGSDVPADDEAGQENQPLATNAVVRESAGPGYDALGAVWFVDAYDASAVRE